jgi:CheY-like chemotaxis protein
MPIEEPNADTGCASFPGPLRASIYALLETVLALSEKVAEMPLCPEQIEHVYRVRDAARELSRLLIGPAGVEAAPLPPRSQPSPGEPGPPDAPVEVGAAAQPCRILLVAGSRYQMAAMKRYLAGIPHHLDFECDSAPALALFRLKRYDVVFLDGRNGGMAPVETAKLMRASERERNLPRTPLVRLASRTEPPGEGDREFDEWLVKPVSRPGLLRAVQRYGLAAWNGGAPLPPAVAGLAGDFLRKAGAALEEARGAVRDADSGPVLAFAEVLAGGGSSLGFQVLAMLGRKLRPASQHHDWPKIGRCLDEIEQCLAAAQL